MKITQIGSPEIVMQNPHSRHNYFGWPTATRLQNGKIAVVASGFRLGHLCPFGKTVISYSENEGKTYSAPAPVMDTPLDDRDGGILAFGESGVIVTSFNNARSSQRRWNRSGNKNEHYVGSYLDLITDEEEEKYLGATFRVSNDCGVTYGPIYKCPISSPHGPCELPDGTLLWVGRTFTVDGGANGGKETLQAYKLNPIDGTSEFVGKIDPIYLDGEIVCSEEPHAIALEDGTVICHIRAEDEKWPHTIFSTYQSVSKDGGKTWSKPERLLDLKGGAPAHIMKHSSGALISVYGYRSAPYGIKAMISLDNGKTWDTDHDIYVNGISEDLGYPSTVELSDGSLITVFYAKPSANSPAIIMQQRWKLEI